MTLALPVDTTHSDDAVVAMSVAYREPAPMIVVKGF